MTKQLNNELINKLAVKYAKTKSSDTLADIMELTRPMIYHEAIKAERRYGYIGIERDEMISEYMQDVWEALSGEAVLKFNGSSNFTQRFHDFFKKSLVDRLKYYNSRKRSDMTTVSLDKTIRVDNSRTSPEGIDASLEYINASFKEMRKTAEEEFIGNEWVNETLAGFARSNEREALIIQMVYHGYETIEIAQALGSPSYDQKTRKAVSRAKSNFKKFIENQNPLSA
jgi:hypothetical protein